MDIKIVNLKGDMLFSETNGKPKDHYDVLENIASGTLGLVKKVKNKFSMCIRAMKVIKKAFIDLQEDEKNFMKEIAILRTLVNSILIKDHPNILKIYEFYQDEKCFYLISEYESSNNRFCNDGDLFDKLSKKNCFDEHCSAYMMKQLLSALLYCHQHNIVHRDIKAENILIESTEVVNEKELYNIRLTDFSSARSFSKSKKLTKKVGTVSKFD
jgi:calcium-dependent protein kinase